MKITNDKRRIPRLSIPTRPSSSAIQTPSLTRSKKARALLIGVKKVRQDAVEITQENDEKPAEEEDVNAVPKPKKEEKKKQKNRDKEKAPEEPELKGPHHDVLQMKELLIDVYHYDPENITVLIDDDDPDHIQPTKENMIQKMIELVEGALPGDRFFFHFSGHATRELSLEKVHKDEHGKTIKNDYLKKLLVYPLPIGSTLNAIFDSCHSCSLLDLEHFRCNRVYVPWINQRRRKTDFPRKIIMRRNAISLRSVTQAKRLSRDAITWKQTSIDQVLSSPVTPSPGFDPIRTRTKKSLSILTDVEKESWYGSSMSPINRCRSPETMYCTGNCRDKPSEEEKLGAEVISLSSSKDSQRSWEDPQGSSMTQALIKVLKNDPNPRLKDLLTLVSHDIHVFYLSLHRSARDYQEKVKNLNDSRQKKGKDIIKPKSVEMNNFQHPQMASRLPLDMNRRWHL